MSGRDLGASVRQRLLNQARSQGRPFQELLQYFATERFLYRLTKSPFADRFVLKGALLLTAWRAPSPGQRWTSIWPEIATTSWRIFGGWRARSANSPLYPTALILLPPRSRFSASRKTRNTRVCGSDSTGRSRRRESRCRSTLVLGMRSSRIKDYYDLALLARLYPFDGDLLAEAIGSTFRHRGTAIFATPVGLTEAFSADPARAVQWRAFVRRSRFESEKAKGDIRISCQNGKMRLSPFAVKNVGTDADVAT